MPYTSVEKSASRVSDEVRAHFLHKYPIMLDGALLAGPMGTHLLRQARESLAVGRLDPRHMPAPVLRETLESLAAAPKPATQAGLTPIGPASARVWWDTSVLENLDDVLAQLDQPKAVLRFYDVTGLDPESGRWHKHFDIDVDLDDAGQTVPLGSDRTYVVDLGYVHADGRFLRLARTNAVRLPREGVAEPDPEGATALSGLRRHAAPDRAIVPDQAARDWAAARADFPERDLDAELLIHMVYRAFLREGPRALRRAPRLLRRGEEELKRDYAGRQRQRARTRVREAAAADSAVLVARLDAVPTARPAALRYQPVHVATPLPLAADPAQFVWCEAVAAAARNGRTAAVRRPALAEPAALVRRLSEDEPVAASASLAANPVFEAARHLRDDLAAMDPLPEAETEVEVTEAFRMAAGETVFGGAEAKRMAKAGVRFTRMALTLEGRMRPGARLKVAGRLVHADAQGRFRLECVLSGKRASIPMRAGTSIEGEARSLINVDWEKRAAGEKRKVYQ